MRTFHLTTGHLLGALGLLLAMSGCSPAYRGPGEGPEPAAAEVPTPAVSVAGVRDIPVTLVADPAFQEIAYWRGLARGAIEMAVADLEASAGLRFHLREELTWESPDSGLDLKEILQAGLSQVGPREGLTIFLLGDRAEPFTTRFVDVGYAFLGRPAMILNPPRRLVFGFSLSPKRNLALAFRHELGHVFGVPHIEGSGVMSGNTDLRRWDYEELSLDIFRATREIDFADPSPFAGCDLDLLRDVYLVLAGQGNMETALLVNLGGAFHNARRPENARTMYEAALRMDRRSIPAQVGLAQALLALGNTPAARTHMDGLAARDDLSPQMSGVLGALWLGVGDLSLADFFLTEAVNTDSTRYSFWFNRGLTRFRQGRYPEARRDFEQALAGEDRAGAWYNLGLTCDVLEDVPCALEAFTRYLLLSPDGAERRSAEQFLEKQRRR